MYVANSLVTPDLQRDRQTNTSTLKLPHWIDIYVEINTNYRAITHHSFTVSQSHYLRWGVIFVCGFSFGLFLYEV